MFCLVITSSFFCCGLVGAKIEKRIKILSTYNVSYLANVQRLLNAFFPSVFVFCSQFSFYCSLKLFLFGSSWYIFKSFHFHFFQTGPLGEQSDWSNWSGLHSTETWILSCPCHDPKMDAAWIHGPHGQSAVCPCQQADACVTREANNWRRRYLRLLKDSLVNNQQQQ